MKKLGIVPYINALPLIYSLNDYELFKAVPSELCSYFDNGSLEAALIPVFELLGKKDVYIIDSISIACHKEAASVLFFLNTSIDKVKKVGIDKSSLSSTHLLKLFLKKKHQQDCEFVVYSPEKLIQQSHELDGYLLIGDKAIYHRQINKSFIDLGKAWYDWTNLPFVFAVWAIKQKDEALKSILCESKKAGLDNIDHIVKTIPYQDKEFLKKYYQLYLNFNLGENEKNGLALYHKWLFAEGFLSEWLDIQYF